MGSTSNLYQQTLTSTGVQASSNLNGSHALPLNPAASLPTSMGGRANNGTRPQQPGYFQPPPPISAGKTTGGPPLVAHQPPINGGYPGMSNGPPPSSGPPSWNTTYPVNTSLPPQGQTTLGSPLGMDPRQQYPQVICK